MNHRRMLAQLHPHPPDANELQTVHAESVNRCPATRRQTYYLGEIHRPAKMTFPSITLRMKQRNIHSAVTITDRYAIRFIAIAGRAGKAQVVEYALTGQVNAGQYVRFRKSRPSTLPPNGNTHSIRQNDRECAGAIRLASTHSSSACFRGLLAEREASASL